MYFHRDMSVTDRERIIEGLRALVRAGEGSRSAVDQAILEHNTRLGNERLNATRDKKSVPFGA